MGYDTNNYGSQTVIMAEGARVAFTICKRCGAVLLHDPRDQPELDPIAIHDEWHKKLLGELPVGFVELKRS